ncbi:MAG TPA: polyamine aminopropyltransferase [Geopsychrobacteraceae bacterium]|nr:polyamine aminopropyltransferase [Geopsychrobacteraceae bacterium]
MSNNIWKESLHDAYGQHFNVDKIYYEQKTDHQHLMIFHNSVFGRVMALDQIVQTTERDEFIYHEMMVHVPIIAHGNVKNVLIIGGGDGGALREVCKHESVEKITQVEIDQSVIDMAIEYLPNHSQGAYDDARVEIIIDDGVRYVNQTEVQYDVIISDSTDPIGPGEVLFSSSFYDGCKRCLTAGGVLTTQNGVPFLQPDEVTETAKKLSKSFADWHFYTAAVPTYIGGIMAFAWATDNIDLRKLQKKIVRERFQATKIKTGYYNPEIHVGAFALPQYLLEALGKGE